MCGILGLIGPRACDAEAFGRALDVMKNRGPDDRGVYEEAECLIGQRRLAILDLSPAGHQPMTYADGRYVAVYNGEVYNFLELRRDLESEGARFTTRTDTEVVLALYAREGTHCLDRLRGMFAIAIWDRQEKSLFLARDRMGIKPLYVWCRPEGIAFASEIKALRALPGGPFDVEPEAVVQYLAWGHVPAPLTATKGVECLMPATWLLWKNGSSTRRSYWDFPVCAPAGSPSTNGFVYRSRGQALEALRPALQRAVAYRCISDAPLGAFLSGGIDSSSVVALMRSAGQKDLHTVSISFPQTRHDEGPYSVKVAEQFGTYHTDVSVAAQTAERELDGFFAAMDQPTCDGFNTFVVSHIARQVGLTVSLSGLGGDELFAGYAHYRRVLRTRWWVEAFPRSAMRAAAWGAANLHPRYAKLEALAIPGPSLARLYYAARGLFAPSEIRKVINPDLLAQTALGRGDASSLLPPMPPGCSLDGLSRSVFHTLAAIELRRYLHDQLLRDSDVFGLARSLEIRVPLIDHELVELIFQTDSAVVLEIPAGHSPKSLLVDALPSPLPRLCTHRPKMGFTFPFAEWVGSAWKGRVESRLLAETAGPAVNADGVRRCWQEYLAQRKSWTRIWGLYVLMRQINNGGIGR
jgi:asparagine synthase (glutamine-hydrolysing)